MPDNEEWTAQELEFVMEGITTRMQIAMEKMSDANQMMSEVAKVSNKTVRNVCVTGVVVILLVVLGFVAFSGMWIAHVNNLRASGVVSAGETVSQLGQGADD